jgi:hypothetical protein
VLGLSYRANTVAVPVTDAPYLRVALRADQELGEVIVNYRTDKTAPEALRTAVQKTGYDADDIMADARAYNRPAYCCKKTNPVH